MFWERMIPKKYLVKQMVCGLEIVLTDNGPQFYFCITKNKNNNLTVMETGVCSALDKLPIIIKKSKLPLIIGITGKGLVYKSCDMPKEAENYEELLGRTFPAIDISEFYIQLYRQVNCQAFISLFRKIQINHLLESIKKSGYEIADIFIGPSFVADVIPLTTMFTSVLTNTALIGFSNSCVENIEPIGLNTEINEKITIEDLSLDKSNILGFSLCYIYFLHTNHNYNYNEELSVFKTRHIEGSKLRMMVYSTVILTFTLCLLNFLLFNNYFNSAKNLETELDLYETKYKQINDLLQSYEEKKVIIEEAGMFEKNRIAEHIDRIASGIPEEVIISDWYINPPIGIPEEDSLAKFSKNSITIKGKCNKSLIINEWVNVLKTQNYIKEVNLEKFNFSTEGQQPNFEIDIKTN